MSDSFLLGSRTCRADFPGLVFILRGRARKVFREYLWLFRGCPPVRSKTKQRFCFQSIVHLCTKRLGWALFHMATYRHYAVHFLFSPDALRSIK
jgi:hypothetical protein